MAARIDSAKDLGGPGNFRPEEIFIKGEIPDPRIMKAFSSLFDRTTDFRDKEVISSWMLSAKDPNPRYFIYLEKLLRNALAIDPPYYVGNSLEIDSSFPSWCESQNLSLGNCQTKYITGPLGVFTSAAASRDVRFLPFFRQCISSNTYWRYCVGGLAINHDTVRLAEIIKRHSETGNPNWPLALTAWDDPAVDQMAIDYATKTDSRVLEAVRGTIASREEQKKKRLQEYKR